jgi:serine phosphatase RsbU (regulator of sigma subunit)
MIDRFSSPFSQHKSQVLVVDDDPDINRLLQVRLRNVGFGVRSAPDGETALELIRQRVPDMILLDISMPGISGLEVLDRIREEKLDVAVVMTTAFGSESIAVDALRRGADDYLRKPFEPSEFRAVIDRTMSRLELSRMNAHLRRQLDAELLQASQIQQNLLPDSNPKVPGYDIAMCCKPAHVVGGDFYDWTLLTESRLAITLGDVMGKGMSAALLMATVRASLRPSIKLNDAAMAVNTISETLQEDLERTRSFVTMFVGYLDSRHHVLQFVDAGHGLAVVARADGSFGMLKGGDVPIGIFPDSLYQAHTTSLEPGDRLLLYSDGLQDSIVDSSALSLVGLVKDAKTAMEAMNALVDQATKAGHWADDVTVIVVQRDRDENE